MKKFFYNLIQVLGFIIMIILFYILFWGYLLVTPDQYSAECEAQREEERLSNLN